MLFRSGLSLIKWLNGEFGETDAGVGSGFSVFVGGHLFFSKEIASAASLHSINHPCAPNSLFAIARGVGIRAVLSRVISDGDVAARCRTLWGWDKVLLAWM